MGYYSGLLKCCAPHALFPWDCVRLACSWQPLWHQAPLLNLEHACQSQPYEGFSCRIIIFLNSLCISSFYSLVLFVVLESYVALIMVCFCLFLHSFQRLVFMVVNTCAFWPLKFQVWICIYLQIEKIYKKCLPLWTNEFFKKLKIFLIGYLYGQNCQSLLLEQELMQKLRLIPTLRFIQILFLLSS